MLMTPRVHDIYSDRCTVTYQAPVVEGGSPINGYLVEYKTPTQPWTPIAKHLIGGTSVRVTELYPNTWYEFRVAAENLYGISKFSSSSVPITIHHNKLSQPGCPAIRSDGRSVDMEWTMTYNDAEIAASSHFIILIRYHSDDSDGRMFVVTGRKPGPVVQHSLSVELKKEIFYAFAVAAVNAAGVGPYSATSQPVRFITGQSFNLAFAV